jgi:hypothetical protein
MLPDAAATARRGHDAFQLIKNVEQQSALMLHRTRSPDPPATSYPTHFVPTLPSWPVAAKGREGLHQLVMVVTECGDERLPSNARFARQAIVTQLHAGRRNKRPTAHHQIHHQRGQQTT